MEIVHRDDLLEAEQVICLDPTSLQAPYYIHLEKIDDDSPAPFTCKYVKIGKA